MSMGLGPAVGAPLLVSRSPCRGSGPFSALFPTRFILDDSALYLSDKCEVETLDLRRGGQVPNWVPSPLRDRCPPAAFGRILSTHTCVLARDSRTQINLRFSCLVVGQGLGVRRQSVRRRPALCFRLCLCLGC